jgi:hypothetical protein
MMTFKSQNHLTTDNDGGWNEREKSFSDLISAIWPSMPSSELSRKISLQDLQATIDSGSLSPEHQVGLQNYLHSLPGYGVPGLKEEAERHHGYLTAHLHRLSVQSEPGSVHN